MIQMSALGQKRTFRAQRRKLDEAKTTTEKTMAAAKAFPYLPQLFSRSGIRLEYAPSSPPPLISVSVSRTATRTSGFIKERLHRLFDKLGFRFLKFILSHQHSYLMLDDDRRRKFYFSSIPVRAH